MSYQDVLDFWFNTLESSDWYKKSDELDSMIKSQFLTLHTSVAQGECSPWRNQAKSALAEVIVLDQFSRNIYRNTPKAFAYDGMALVLSQYAIKNNFEDALEDKERHFLYMPYMHSESKLIQSESLRLFGENNSFALEHKHVIDKFGRFPHRNSVLGRMSTAEELKYLEKNTGW